jgi:hypothetical protein
MTTSLGKFFWKHFKLSKAVTSGVSFWTRQVSSSLSTSSLLFICEFNFSLMCSFCTSPFSFCILIFFEKQSAWSCNLGSSRNTPFSASFSTASSTLDSFRQSLEYSSSFFFWSSVKTCEIFFYCLPIQQMTHLGCDDAREGADCQENLHLRTGALSLGKALYSEFWRAKNPISP